MKLEITEKKNNELIGRVEIKAHLVYQGVTPSNADITADVAKQLKVDESLVVVKQIKGIFSKQESNVTAVAYKDAKVKLKYEMSTKHLRKIAEEKAKKDAEEKEAAAEAKKKEQEEKAAAKEAEKSTETKETPAEVPATE